MARTDQETRIYDQRTLRVDLSVLTTSGSVKNSFDLGRILNEIRYIVQANWIGPQPWELDRLNLLLSDAGTLVRRLSTSPENVDGVYEQIAELRSRFAHLLGSSVHLESRLAAEEELERVHRADGTLRNACESVLHLFCEQPLDGLRLIEQMIRQSLSPLALAFVRLGVHVDQILYPPNTSEAIVFSCLQPTTIIEPMNWDAPVERHDQFLPSEFITADSWPNPIWFHELMQITAEAYALVGVSVPNWLTDTTPCPPTATLLDEFNADLSQLLAINEAVNTSLTTMTVPNGDIDLHRGLDDLGFRLNLERHELSLTEPDRSRPTQVTLTPTQFRLFRHLVCAHPRSSSLHELREDWSSIGRRGNVAAVAHSTIRNTIGALTTVIEPLGYTIELTNSRWRIVRTDG